MSKHESQSKRPSLFVQVVIGFAVGVACGLFFGELAGRLKVIGDAYVRLLQMTVIPYIVVSLVGGLGRLTLAAAGRMAVHAGTALLTLWAVIILTALLGPLAFPDLESAAFFSRALTETREEVDFLGLYIPSNPYQSLANGVVPAVVVFSLALGLGLIAAKGKEAVLGLLSTLSEAIMAITRFIVGLTPIGVFAITASAAGTLRIEEFARLQIYGTISVASCLLLLFCSLPLLVVARTPVRYRQVFGHARNAIVTAFATGNLLIVLPMLTDAVKALAGEHGVESEESLGTVDVVAPSAYSLPSGGLFLTLAFVLFAGWFAGSSIGVESYPTLTVVGLFTSFGGTNISIPFLLDLFRVPADLFQLYLVSDVVLGRPWTAFAAMFVLVLCTLMVFGLEDRLERKPRRRLIYAGGTLALTAVLFGVLGVVLGRVYPHEYEEYGKLVGMQLSGERAPSAVLDEEPPPLPTADAGRSRLELIRERGAVRVGYVADALPYAYRNDAGEPVGLDIEMAHSLARDLGVRLELARLPHADIADWLSSGRIDIVMSGVVMTPELAHRVAFTSVYLEETLAFIVPDHRRKEFKSLESLRQRESLRLAVPDVSYMLTRVRAGLPAAEIVPVQSPRPYLRGELAEVDALLFSAESGSAWTLAYPQFSVVVPEPLLVKAPLAYPLPPDEGELSSYVNAWLDLSVRTGQVDRLFEYWVLGQGATPTEPRWSVIRNVLHWVD